MYEIEDLGFLPKEPEIEDESIVPMDEPLEYRTLDFMGFPGYRVGNDGSVWTRLTNQGMKKGLRRLGRKWRRMSNRYTRGDYCSVRLHWQGVHKIFMVHILVITAFQGPAPRKGMIVRHLNDVPKDNRNSNLKWGSRTENGIDAIRNGSKTAKLNPEKVKRIRHLYHAKKLGLNQIARIMKVANDTIGQVIRNKTWRHVK